MDKQNLMPKQAQPVNRNTTGQLPSEAELSEEVLEQQGSNAFGASVQPSFSLNEPEHWHSHHLALLGLELEKRFHSDNVVPVDMWVIGRE